MTPSGGRLIVAATAAACALVVTALPRAVEPMEPPWLLPAARGAEPSAPPLDDPNVDRLVALVRERSAFERDGVEPPSVTRERAERTRALAGSLERNLGEAALRSIARHLAAKIEAAVSDPPAGDVTLVGDFERQLARHRALVGDRVVAPRVVLRALAAARVATLFEMSHTRFMTPREEEAYFAWAALRGGDEELRDFGLDGWETHDPARADEARAYFAYAEGKFARAARLYERVVGATSELAPRNHALAALSRVEASEAR